MRRLKTLIPAFTLLAVSGMATAADLPPSAVIPVDPLALYGESMRFSVFRKGERVGRHLMTFQRDGNAVTVTADFEINIKFLFFNAYRFHYLSTARWKDGLMERLSADIDDDGERLSVMAEPNDSGMIVTGPEGTVSASRSLIPTNHWNPAVLKAEMVLNTLTGRINNVRLVGKGVEEIEAEGRRIKAYHYVYTGDLDTEVWYDARGRWVKMRFAGRDGSTIDYLCELCGQNRQSLPGE